MTTDESYDLIDVLTRGGCGAYICVGTLRLTHRDAEVIRHHDGITFPVVDPFDTGWLSSNKGGAMPPPAISEITLQKMEHRAGYPVLLVQSADDLKTLRRFDAFKPAR